MHVCVNELPLCTHDIYSAFIGMHTHVIYTNSTSVVSMATLHTLTVIMSVGYAFSIDAASAWRML